MTPVIVEKRRALAAHKACPSKRNLQALWAAYSKVWQTARKCAKDHWPQPCSQIRSVAGAGNFKGVYDGVKQALGPTKKKTPLLKSATGGSDGTLGETLLRVILERECSYRWNTERLKCLTVLEELDSNSTLKQLNRALAFASGKGPGNDSIPAEALKCWKENIISELHEILCLCWKEGEGKLDMRDTNIVTLHKNKGDRSDWNNYQSPISHNYSPIMKALYSYLTNLLVLAWQSIIKLKLTVASPPLAS